MATNVVKIGRPKRGSKYRRGIPSTPKAPVIETPVIEEPKTAPKAEATRAEPPKEPAPVAIKPEAPKKKEPRRRRKVADIEAELAKEETPADE